MRIGSVLIVLLETLAGSGCLLSDNIHNHQDLKAFRQNINQALKDKEAMQNQRSPPTKLSRSINILNGLCRKFFLC
jgi:hypothetical protein